MQKSRAKLVRKDGSDGIVITNKNAGLNLMVGFQDLRTNKFFCDIVLKVADKEIFAHRSVLAICSEYFRAMFIDQFKELQLTEVTLESISKEAAEILVEFMYTGQLNVTKENVQDLIVVADQWQLTDVKDLCAEFVEEQLNPYNCLGVSEFAETYNCKKLQIKGEQIWKQRFPSVVLTQEFLELSGDRLWKILKCPDITLGHSGEDVVLKAVMRWVNHDYETRVRDLPRLLRRINLASTSAECRRQVLDINSRLVGNSDIHEIVESQLTMPKQQRRSQAVIVVIGGFLQARTGSRAPRIQGAEMFDTRSNSWSVIADFPLKSSGAVALNLCGHLFCLAYEPVRNPGRGASFVTETGMFEYDLVKNQWFDARDRFSDKVVTCIDECLQAGGALAVCEETSRIYTVSSSEICRIPFTELNGDLFCRDVHYLPKPTFLSPSHCMHSAIVVNQNLYVLGGGERPPRSDPVASNLVVMFDPTTDQWMRKNGMLEERLKMDVAAINGQIYASGGFNIRRLNTVERYNPDTDLWLRVPSMHQARSHHKMVNLDGRLWALGGKSFSHGDRAPKDVINACEVYNPDQNNWTDAPDMRRARCNFAAVVL